MFNAIGAHIYAGGFTVGVSKHFNVLAHLEHAAYGEDVVKLNFPEMPIYAGGPAMWPKTWPKGAARPRFVYANPPCAIWSSAGAKQSSDWRKDPRLLFHHDIFNYATEVVKTDVLSIESVPPSFTRGREHVNELINKAKNRGYSLTVVLHDAQYFGVAQRRSRIFYVFHKIVVDWLMPRFDAAPTIREILKKVGRHRTKGFDPVISTSRKSRIELLKYTAPGGKLRQTYDRLYPDPDRGNRGQKVGRPSFLDQRVSWDKPSPVLIADKLYHPVEDRFLDQEELAAICSFPANYLWPKGTSGDVSGWMSRGVMPKAGEWLAENISRALDANKRINEPTSNVLDIAKPPGRYYPLLSTQEETMPRKTAVQVQAPLATSGPPDKEVSEGSGAYMRRLLVAGFQTPEILEAVHRQFPGSKAGPSDVAYNKNKLKKDGAAPVIVEAKPLDKSKIVAPPWEPPATKASNKEASPYAMIRSKVHGLRGRADKATTAALIEIAVKVVDMLEDL
jgi:site-specific DNA-cytosine methylase